MSEYLFVESRDPFEEGAVKQSVELASGLVAEGHRVRVYLVANAVLVARRGAKAPQFYDPAQMRVWVDDVSLQERDIAADRLRPGFALATMDTLAGWAMADRCKVLWL